MPDPVVLLKKDHREVAAMLKTLEASKPGARRRQIGREARRRAEFAHEDRRVGHLSPRGEIGRRRGRTRRRASSTGLRRDGVAKLHELVDEPGFGAAVAMLTAGIKHHVKEEEQEMFPALKKKLDRAGAHGARRHRRQRQEGPVTASVARGIGQTVASRDELISLEATSNIACLRRTSNIAVLRRTSRCRPQTGKRMAAQSLDQHESDPCDDAGLQIVAVAGAGERRFLLVGELGIANVVTRSRPYGRSPRAARR